VFVIITFKSPLTRVDRRVAGVSLTFLLFYIVNLIANPIIQLVDSWCELA
jgi:hypothetical protein